MELHTSRLLARIALPVIAILLCGVLVTVGSHGYAAGVPGVQETASSPAGPSPSTSCAVPVPAGLPTPSPLCVTASSAPAPASPSPSPGRKKDAGKKKEEDEQRITIQYKAKTQMFVGEVRSIGKCEDLRRVVLFRVTRGSDERIGKDITNSAARYSIAVDKAAGQYYVRAPESISIGYATAAACKKDTSKRVAVKAAK